MPAARAVDLHGLLRGEAGGVAHAFVGCLLCPLLKTWAYHSSYSFCSDASSALLAEALASFSVRAARMRPRKEDKRKNRGRAPASEGCRVRDGRV